MAVYSSAANACHGVEALQAHLLSSTLAVTNNSPDSPFNFKPEACDEEYTPSAYSVTSNGPSLALGNTYCLSQPQLWTYERLQGILEDCWYDASHFLLHIDYPFAGSPENSCCVTAGFMVPTLPQTHLQGVM
jgi:hypothetical protein